MDKKTANILYVILIVSLIMFMIWFIFWLQTESKECITNPVKYFIGKNEHIYCNCYDYNNTFINRINEEVFNVKP